MTRFDPIGRFPTQGLVAAGQLPNQGLVPTGTKTSDLEGTAWTVPYVDGNTDVQELALGASGTVLTSNGASSAPSWQTPTAYTTTVRAYATADQSVTNSATLVNSTYLSLTLVAGKTYFLQGWLYMIAQTGGYKLDLGGGGCSATNVVAGAVLHDDAATAVENTSLVTSLTATINKNNSGTFDTRLNGTIEVNAGGTLILRFAQNGAGGAGTSNTIKRGSWLQATLLS